MKIERTKLPGVMVFTPDVYEDDRGYFMETLNKYQYFAPVQANQSVSKKGVVRGMHYQYGAAKLVWVAKGAVYDVALNQDTGEHYGIELSADNHRQLLVPEDYAHGFQALEDDTIVCYLMGDYYNPNTEGGYNPEFIKWPLSPIMSDKDRDADQFSL